MKDWFPVNFRDLFKGLVFSIFGTALILCFIFIAYSLVFTQVTADPAKVKGILERSNLYLEVPPLLYDQTMKETDRKTKSILDEPEVRQIALGVYDKGFARSNTENLIDSLYAWLEGKKNTPPELQINLAEKNKEFAVKLGNYAEERARELPICTQANAQDFQATDIFNAKCRPLGLTPAAINADIRKVISSDDEFLNLRTKSQKKESDPGYTTPNDLPQAYTVAKSIPLALIIIATALGVLIFYISENRISGLKRLSRLSLGSGILTALMPMVFSVGGTALIQNTSGNDRAKSVSQSVLEAFMAEASKVYYSVALILLVLAAGLYFLAKKQEATEDKNFKKKA